MGCSPSRGNKLNGVQGPYSKGKTLLPGTSGTSEDGQPDDGETVSRGGDETDGKACDKRIIGENRLEGDIDSVPSLVPKHNLGEQRAAKCTPERLDTEEISIHVSSQRKEKHIEREHEKRSEKIGIRKNKHQKNEKPCKKKEKRRSFTTEKKVDFPEQLVKAHQAAYGYLNPSIDKYELLLGLLDNAAQTHISLQPMAMFMALQYEKFNQEIKKIVEEGEKLLKEHEGHFAWPNSMNNLSSRKRNTTEPPPDLLQQLLQYTVQRMRLMGQSVKGIGDTALEETVDYLSFISGVLGEKLTTKRALEARLMQLLTRIDVASLRQPGPEDSLLFSEDSGISVETESLAGSDRQHHRRESCESTESSHTVIYGSKNSTPIHQVSFRRQLNSQIKHSSSVTSSDSTCYSAIKVCEDSESLLGSGSMDDCEDNEDNANEQSEGERRTCPNFLPQPDHQKLCKPIKQRENPQNRDMTLKMKDAISERINFISSQHSGDKIKLAMSKSNDQQWTEAVEKSPKRPLSATHQTTKKKTTVTKQRRSRSEESLRNKAEDQTLLELERTQEELSKRIEKMGKSKRAPNVKKEVLKPKKQTQCTQPHTSPLTKNHQKEISEKIVIGNQEKEKDKKKTYNTVKEPMKATLLPSPPLPSPNSVKKLIDTFSQGIEESKQFQESVKGLGPLKGVRKYGVPVIPGLGSNDAYSCIKNDNHERTESSTSDIQSNVDLDNLPPPPLEVLMDNSFKNVEKSKTAERVNRKGWSTLPKTTSMSQKFCTSMQSVTILPNKGSVRTSSSRISPTQHTAQHPDAVGKNSQVTSTTSAELSNEEAALLYKQARKIIPLRCSSDSPTENPPVDKHHIQQLTQRSVVRDRRDENLPETVPSSTTTENQSSITRLLPSTPKVHRRLPSPPVTKKQPSSSSPVIFRKLPSPPPASQLIPPTTTTNQNATPRCISGVTYPFRAPSPPASPKVGRCSRAKNSEDISLSVFSNACSVFCPVSPSLFEAKPILVPKPPEAWTSSGSSILPRPWGDRGRQPTFVRGPQTFIRRSQSDRRPSLNQSPRASEVSIAQSCGSEPAINTQGLENKNSWNKPLLLRESNRASSNPDLCIVGQALQCE